MIIDNRKILPILTLGAKVFIINADMSELPIQKDKLGCIVDLFDGVVQSSYISLQSLLKFNPNWEEVEKKEEVYQLLRDQINRYLSHEEMMNLFLFCDNQQNGEEVRNSKESVTKDDVFYLENTPFRKANCEKCGLFSEGKCSRIGDVDPNGWCKLWFSINSLENERR